jgi:transcriptional regulator with XRE-family HTH domain
MIDLSHLGAHVHRLRRSHGLGLAALAEATGVSASMLSAIERAEKAPTVVVLSKIADGLGMTLAQLLADVEPDRVIIRRAGDHDVIDEPGGWQRTVLTPVVPGVGFEWIRTTLPAGCDAGTYPAYAPGSHEFIHVETGTLDLTVDATVHELQAGDTLYFPSDVDHAYANPGTTSCTYNVAALIMRSRTAGTRPTIIQARNPAVGDRGAASDVT